MHIELPVIESPKPPLHTLDDVVAAYIRDKRLAALATHSGKGCRHTNLVAKPYADAYSPALTPKRTLPVDSYPLRSIRYVCMMVII
jgi:hypothetical protein